MKHYLFIILIFLSFNAVAGDKPSIVVDELYPDNISKKLAKNLTNRLRLKLLQTGKYSVLSRDDMDIIIFEKKLNLDNGNYDHKKFIKYWRSFETDKYIEGGIYKKGNRYKIELSLTDLKKDVYERRIIKFCDCTAKELYWLLDKSTAELMEIPYKGPAFKEENEFELTTYEKTRNIVYGIVAIEGFLSGVSYLKSKNPLGFGIFFAIIYPLTSVINVSNNTTERDLYLYWAHVETVCFYNILVLSQFKFSQKEIFIHNMVAYHLMFLSFELIDNMFDEPDSNSSLSLNAFPLKNGGFLSLRFEF